MSVQSPSPPPSQPSNGEEERQTDPKKAGRSSSLERPPKHRNSAIEEESDGSSDGELCIDETSSDTDVESDEATLKNTPNGQSREKDEPRRRKSSKWASKHHCEQLEDEVILLRSKLRQISSLCVEMEERFTRRCSAMSGEIQALYQMVANYQLLASQANKANNSTLNDQPSSVSSSNPTNHTNIPSNTNMPGEQRLSQLHRPVPTNPTRSDFGKNSSILGPQPQAPSTAAQVALQNIAEIRSSQFATDMVTNNPAPPSQNSMSSQLGRFPAHLMHESVAGATSLPSLRSMASGLASGSLSHDSSDHHNQPNSLGLSGIRYYRGQSEPPRVAPPQDSQRPIKYRIPDTPRKQLSKGRRGNLPSKATAHLRAWLFAHRNRPYPTEEQKAELVALTDLTLVQINNWFSNARRRILKVDEKNRQKDKGSGDESGARTPEKTPEQSKDSPPPEDHKQEGEEPPKKRFKSEPTSPS